MQNPLLVAAFEPFSQEESVHLDICRPPVLKAPFRELSLWLEENAELHRRAEPLALFTEDIQPTSWNASAFDHLVYGQQLILRPLRRRHPQQGPGHSSSSSAAPPPGTGKTLTVEAVANPPTRRPPFNMQAEHLSIRADTLGTRIGRIFDRATD